MKKIMYAAFAAVIALASCNKEPVATEPAQEQGEMKAVTIDLSNVGASLKSSAAEAGTAASLANFNVFFADAAGNAYYKGKNADGTEAAHYYSSVVTSLKFHFLDPKVTQAIVVANMGDLSSQNLQTVADIEALSVEVANQQVANIATLVMYGKSEAFVSTGAHTDTHPSVPVYKAAVEIKPLISRMEVRAFGVNFDENKFKSVTFETLGFDNYYVATTIAGIKDGTDLVTEEFANLDGDVHKEELKTALATYFAAQTGNEWYCDNVVATLNNGDKVTVTTAAPSVELTNGHFYAYHFFPKSGVTSYLVDGYPRLCAKVTTVNHANIEKVQYVITKNFSGLAAEGFLPGTIYQINYVFPEKLLEGDLICADIEITVKPWEIVSLTPEW